MQTIYLDISNKGVIPTIYAKQGDVGRKFLVVLTDSGIPYAPPAGSVFSVWYDGASGEGNYTDVGSSPAIIVNANTVKVELITQMLQNEGEGKLCLVLNEANGDQISSWNISYICEAVPGHESEEAKAYFTAFSNAVQNLPYPDVSLSTQGKAADAAAVGAALAGKAPAGFGLGGQATTVNSPDDAVQNGFYRCPVISELGSGGYMSGWVVNNEDGWISQYWNYFGSRVRREMEAGVWQQYEWINPRLSNGVEYRTTERWNGKPVYAKLVDCGTMPNASMKAVAHNSAVTWIVRCEAYDVSMKRTLPQSWSGEVINVFADAGYVCIETNTDCSTRTAYAQIWYTKD